MLFSFKKDEISFDVTRYVNSHFDYSEYKRGNRYYINCFKLPGNQLPIYRPGFDDGKLFLGTYSHRNITIQVADYAGNTSSLSFVLKYQPKEAAPAMPKGITQRFSHTAPNTFSVDDFHIDLPAGALYDDVNFLYNRVELSESITVPVYSQIHSAHNTSVPLHKNATIRIKPVHFPEKYKQSAILAYINERNNIRTVKGTWRNGFLTGASRSFGKYFITVDTLPPTVKPYYEAKAKNYAGRETIQFKISDDLSGIDNYSVTLNGKWLLFEYDAKTRRLIHYFDSRIPKGNHTLHVSVTDYVGNKTKFEYSFVR